MRKFNALAITLLLLTALGSLFCVKKVKAENNIDKQSFRVGLEASYPPFNWTQNDDKNGAVEIEGISGQYANGYDVNIAKIVAKKLDKKLIIVKTAWLGLVPALTSGKIDAIIGGMNPTRERRQEIDFTKKSYYESEYVLIVNSNGKYKNAKKLSDFENANITAQQGTNHYDLIDQIAGAKKKEAMIDFSQMRQALKANIIDAYIAERPEGLGIQAADKSYKMIEIEKSNFKFKDDALSVCIGTRKGDRNLELMDEALLDLTKEKQTELMNLAIKWQLDALTSENSLSQEKNFFLQTFDIIKNNGIQFAKGAGFTLFIALFGTIIGLIIGLGIGVYRTKPKSYNKTLQIVNKIFIWFLSAYIEIFRGTPMIVQAMVIYYGSAQVFNLNIDKTLAALFIVSVNTGAYMSEIVRGGIYAVDKGQFEAASAIGMTHNQAMTKIVLPQVIRNILPATGNEFVINVKDTSVLNVISVVELYFSGNTVAAQNYQYFQTFAIIAAIYFIMTFTATRILRFVERNFDKEKDFTNYTNQMQVKDAADKNYKLLKGNT